MSHAQLISYEQFTSQRFEVDRGRDDVDFDQAAVEKKMLSRFRQPGFQPPVLPAVAFKLMEIGRGAEVETSEIVSLLEQDPMLAAHIVRISNSPIYGNVGRIRSIRDAVVRLGRVNLMNCVLEVAVSARVFRVRGYEGVMGRLSVHSRATGHLARIVSDYTWASGEFVFLCGLLHDVGLAGILIALSDVPKGDPVPRLDLPMLRAIDNIHAEAGAILCDLWGLPRDISLVVGKHHELLIDRYPHPLAGIVCLAEHLANSFALGWTGTSFSEIDRSDDGSIQKAKDVLRIDDAKWALIERDAEKLIRNF